MQGSESLAGNVVQSHSKAPPWGRLCRGEARGPALRHDALLGETDGGAANSPVRKESFLPLFCW